MQKTCLEVALNGPWSQARQPGMPVTTADLIAEGIACADLGASVIHVHVYNPDTGRQFEDADAYRAVIEGIRAEKDVIVYPTLPLAGSADAPAEMTPQERFAVVEQLAQAGLLEWTVVDPGSTLFLSHEDAATGTPGFLYDNPEGDIRRGLMLGERHGFHPSYAIYEPGFLRAGATLARCYPGVPRPVYRFMFSDGFTFGYPPRAYALESYLHLLEEEDSGAAWMVAGLQVDIRPLIGAAVARGGHVRVGLEDAPFGSELSNMEWTEAAVRAIEAAGGTPASTEEVRAMVR